MLAAPPVVVHCFIPAASDAASAFQKQGAQFVLTASSFSHAIFSSSKVPNKPILFILDPCRASDSAARAVPAQMLLAIFTSERAGTLCRDGLSGSRELGSPRAKRDARHLSAFVVFSLSLSHSVPLVFCCFSLPPLSWPAFLRGLRCPLFQAR